jgi:predicted acyltransferase
MDADGPGVPDVSVRDGRVDGDVAGLARGEGRLPRDAGGAYCCARCADLAAWVRDAVSAAYAVALDALLRVRGAAADCVCVWVLLRFVPLPGYGTPTHQIALLDQTRNWVSYVDRAVVAWSQTWLHTGALYGHGRDPEGLLSTLPAIATVLLGAMTGVWMRRAMRKEMRVERMRVGLELAGFAVFVAGVVWSHWMPVNKNLWTPSFVLLTAGIAAMALAACSWLVDARHGRWPVWLRVTTWPWFVYGANAIAAFVISEAIVKVMIFIRWYDAAGHVHTPWSWTYATIFARGHSTVWTSLAFAVAFVVVCFLPNWWMWHKRVFLKI